MEFSRYLQRLIDINGPMTIASFMTEALQNPEYGYYQKKVPFGSKGDFTTAPETSQLFGEMVGIWVSLLWQNMQKPSSFILLEYGPGKATMMKDIIRATSHIKKFHDSCEIHLIENSPILKDIQKKNLSDINIKICWHTDISTVPDKPAIIVANEFFDALPIHQYYKTSSGWRERMVTYSNKSGSFEFILGGALSLTKDLKKQHEKAKIGSFLEISPASCYIIKEISRYIKKNQGAALIIDYGYSSFLYQNTFQSLKNHKFNNVLENIGNADMTAHVNFIELCQVVKKEGLDCFVPISQRDFLINFGIELRLEMLLSNLSDNLKITNLTSGVNSLIDKKEMGELFKVLLIQNSNLSEVFGFKSKC